MYQIEVSNDCLFDDEDEDLDDDQQRVVVDQMMQYFLQTPYDTFDDTGGKQYQYQTTDDDLGVAIEAEQSGFLSL